MSKKKINISSVIGSGDDLDALFGGTSLQNIPEEKAEEIKSASTSIPIKKLRSHHNHSYKVKDDADMDTLVDSIKEIGIIVPLIVREVTGGYEIIAGHRRCRAAELAGLKEVPCLIVDVDDDTSDVFMVDSNAQRERILPSEKAKSYRIKYDALQRMGKDSITDNDSEETLDSLASTSDDSRTQIHRYLRLSKLNDELLEMMDEDLIGLVAGVTLSFLNRDNQQAIIDVIYNAKTSITTKQAEMLRTASKRSALTVERVEEIISGKKAARSDAPKKIKFNEATFKSLVPETISKLPLDKRIRYHERALAMYAEYLKEHPEDIDNI